MTVNPHSSIEITAFSRVPPIAEGFVRDLRPRWACEEIGLDYAERLLDAMTPRPESYFREQPWGQVPVIKDGDISLFESGAILLHLGEKDERLLPKSGQARAAALSWLFAAFNSVEPFELELLLLSFSKDEDWAKLRRTSLVELVEKRLDRLSDALGERDYLAGQFCIADIAMATVLREAQHTDLVSLSPRLAKYVARCLARPAFGRALAAQMAAFRAGEPAEAEARRAMN